ncbi:unnamed protein product [Rotaria sp. Silwood1]|nr:unnamed protein product [Rotaria sp. Silwood1]
MNAHQYQQSEAPPPSYDSVVNNNRQEHRLNINSNHDYSHPQQDHISDFDAFINRYETTDGIPTDERGQTDIHTLEHVLKNERQPTNLIPVTIIACTDDEQCIGYLNDWDRKIPNLDVVDDYRSEKKEIQACRVYR